jgi:hypothetical protein
MFDSVNSSSSDHSVDQSDVTTQTVTNKVHNRLLSATLESGEMLTNVFIDTDPAEPGPAQINVFDKKKAGPKGGLPQIFDRLHTFFKPQTTRSLTPVFQAPNVLYNTETDISVLPSKQEVEQKPMRLPNPLVRAYSQAGFNALTIWNKYNDNIPAEKSEELLQIVRTYSEAWHIPSNDPKVFITFDFATLVALIRKLRKKVGLSELVVMILLALILKHKLYTERGWKSEAAFFRAASEIMGISSSRARDYSKRGTVLLNYYTDLFQGIGEVSGISHEELVVSHMSKLTIYEKAVEKYGHEEALSLFKSLTFREFQDKVAARKPDNKAHHTHVAQSKSSDGSPDVHQEQIKLIKDLNLAPHEQRLLRIIVKGGIYYSTKYLTEEQLVELETRLRKKRVTIFENNLNWATANFECKGFDPNNPLAFSEELFELFNIDDMMLRIRSGLALIVPARRTIAILLYRLFNEKKNEWQHPYGGPDYKNFRDFASEKLGMGKEYRDYLRVGKVLMSHYYFLNGLTDMDTEDMFFKLRYLETALKTHKDNEPLVLRRLRTLSIREFKVFSELPDFEITFSKRLTKKKLEAFYEALRISRTYEEYHLSDYIEIYSQDDQARVDRIVDDILREAGTLNDPPKKREPIHEMPIDTILVQQVSQY